MHYYIDYLSKEQKSNISKSLKKLKFSTFLPNANEAENPFPTSLPLLVNAINIWFPVDNIVEGRVFPVKTFNTLSLKLPPSKILKK